MSGYSELTARMARGWNTWHTWSVLTHALLPEGLGISLAVKNYQKTHIIRESLIGRFEQDDEQIHPGPRSYDGSYTELNWKHWGLELLIQSAVVDGEQHLLVTPLAAARRAPALIVELHMLWNRPGVIDRRGGQLFAELPGMSVTLYCDGTETRELNAGIHGCYISVSLDRPVAVSTGKPVGAGEMALVMARAKAELMKSLEPYGEHTELFSAIRTCMAWDTIYEPEREMVCSPVSRLWSIGWGGYVLFCWDTYFASMLAMADNPNLACANALAITRERTERGFVPNSGGANDNRTRDRSQPPVGSLAIREIFRRHRELWLVREVFDDLLQWNRWWAENRMEPEHVLCWGSDPYEPVLDAYWETHEVDNLQGAKFESGLDNSPMYDDVPYDGETHRMRLADVGLTGLYIMDCEALADLACLIGRSEEAELRERSERVKQGLETLWDEQTGIYQNKRTDTGEFYRRLSPTNFYALFSDRVSPERAGRMMEEHFYNPDEFWGEFMLPSIARNDPAYPDQEYWRGRIWAPMNFLAYLAMRKAGLDKPCSDLAGKSVKLFLQEWRAHGHVHENYHGDDGWGCGIRSSDKFYHWGALLCLIGLIDSGAVSGPERPLQE